MVVSRRERQQVVTVVLRVAEGYQALVLTAVVPVQLMLTQRERNAVVEDAFHVVDGSFLVVHLVRSKETGRRHLLAVAHDNKRLAAGNGSNGLTGGHLRSLVEDDQVKLLGIQVDVLRHGDGTHQHTRAQPG